MNSLKTKKELQKDLEDCQQRILIGKDIKAVIEQFRHYKAVNKKFVDKLEEFGYNSYLNRNNNIHRLVVTKTIRPYVTISVDISVYGEDLTWDGIERQLEWNLGREKKLLKKLEDYDKDLIQLKGLVSYMETMPEGSNFESEVSSFLTDLKWQIEKIERV